MATPFYYLFVLWGGPTGLKSIKLALPISNKSVISNVFHEFMAKNYGNNIVFCIDLKKTCFQKGVLLNIS